MRDRIPLQHLDLVAKLRRARADVQELTEENAYIKALYEKERREREILEDIIAALSRGFVV